MAESNAGTVVQTSCGSLRGCIEGNVRVFRGVPFAQPPIGERRFRAPVAMHWDAVRDASEAGPAAPQVNSQNMDQLMELVREFDEEGVPGIISGPPYVFKTYDHEKVSEDCLYLDIWAPLSKRENLPVYVYYHGGANIVSSGSFEPERGANLAAEEEIIVVRPNYRLGALGWVHFGLISDEFPEAINLGVQDQIAALRWIHENIEAFGGDPTNITTGGESAGATAVSNLLVNPEARKLVRRAIIQSLSPFNVWCTQERPEAVAVARSYLRLLGIEKPADLTNVDPQKFLAVHNILLRWFPADANLAWSPTGAVVDGDIIPQMPAQHLSSGDIPNRNFELMIGFAKDEWQFFRGHSKTLKEGTQSDVRAVVEQVFGPEHTETLFHAYSQFYPDHDHRRLLNDIMSMEFFKFPSLQIALHFAPQGVPTYLFQFSIDLPGGGGAIHTGDMPFIFRNYSKQDMERWPAFQGFDTSLIPGIAETFGRMYGSFIRNGKPEPEASWLAFEADKQTILWFGTHIEPRPKLLAEEMAAFEKAGVTSVLELQNRLTRNVREALALRPVC